jgi:hypothetical protein
MSCKGGFGSIETLVALIILALREDDNPSRAQFT